MKVETNLLLCKYLSRKGIAFKQRTDSKQGFLMIKVDICEITIGERM